MKLGAAGVPVRLALLHGLCRRIRQWAENPTSKWAVGASALGRRGANGRREARETTKVEQHAVGMEADTMTGLMMTMILGGAGEGRAALALTGGNHGGTCRVTGSLTGSTGMSRAGGPGRMGQKGERRGVAAAGMMEAGVVGADGGAGDATTPGRTICRCCTPSTGRACSPCGPLGCLSSWRATAGTGWCECRTTGSDSQRSSAMVDESAFVVKVVHEMS